jgi:putative ABC transport system ATP-binding protein
MKTSTSTRPPAEPVAFNAEPTVSGRGICHSFGEGELKKQILFDVRREHLPRRSRPPYRPLRQRQDDAADAHRRPARRARRTTVRPRATNSTAPHARNWSTFAARLASFFRPTTCCRFSAYARTWNWYSSSTPTFPSTRRPSVPPRCCNSSASATGSTTCPRNSPAARSNASPSPAPLVAGPKLILADEPTAALDGKSGRAVVDLLQSLAREQGCPRADGHPRQPGARRRRPGDPHGRWANCGKWNRR